MFGFIIYLLLIGLVAGFIARALVPGKDSMSVGATIVLGIVGSFIGGAIWALFSDDKILDFHAGGLILSVLGAVVALLIYNRVADRRKPAV